MGVNSCSQVPKSCRKPSQQCRGCYSSTVMSVFLEWSVQQSCMGWMCRCPHTFVHIVKTAQWWKTRWHQMEMKRTAVKQTVLISSPHVRPSFHITSARPLIPHLQGALVVITHKIWFSSTLQHPRIMDGLAPCILSAEYLKDTKSKQESSHFHQDCVCAGIYLHAFFLSSAVCPQLFDMKCMQHWTKVQKEQLWLK